MLRAALLAAAVLVPSYCLYPSANEALAPPVALPLPTTWPATENPIAQGSPSSWVQGGADGVDWHNIQSTGGSPGSAYSAAFVTTPGGFDDCIAHLHPRYGISTASKCFVEWTYLRPGAGAYTPPGSQEAYPAFFVITAHSAKGYEFTVPYGDPAGAFSNGVDPVRWNGALGDFTDNGSTPFITLISGSSFILQNGDVFRVELDPTGANPVFTLYLNAVQQWKFSDSSAGKITSILYPAQGNFVQSGTGADLTKTGNSRFNAGNF